MNTLKFQNLVLWACQDSLMPMTTVRLCKTLWYLDKKAFLANHAKITGCRYIRKPQGPVPLYNHDALSIMRDKKLLKFIENPLLGKDGSRPFKRVEYLPLAEPDKSVFPEPEAATIEKGLSEIRSRATSWLVHHSHDFNWASTPDGEEIPFEMYAVEFNLDKDGQKREQEIIEAAEEDCWAELA